MTAVYAAWCSLVETRSALIARVAGLYGLEVDRVLRSSLLCVALHDVGKLSRNFQRMMRAKDDIEYRKAVGMNYRHEIAAIKLVDEAAKALDKQAGPFPGSGMLEVLAVAGHHKYIAKHYLLDSESFKQDLAWEPDTRTAVESAFALACAMFEDRGWTAPGVELSSKLMTRLIHDALSQPPKNPPHNFLLETQSELLKREASRKGRLRNLFVLLKGLLMTADWMASGAQGKEEGLDAARGIVRVRPIALEGHLRERVERRRADRLDVGSEPFAFREFQSECAEADGHVVAIAPTGSGKTEAAWLWALGQVERGHVRKILVLLPTMVTANSIHDRFRAFLEGHGHEVGLVHSTADLIRHRTELGEDEADRPDVRADHLSETHFFRPATVGTVDQLLVPLLHAGRWAMKTMAAADSAIIIDEVHAYHPHTLGLIALMIKQLAPLCARFMVMSATMPEALEATFRESLKPAGGGDTHVRTIKDQHLLASARNRWTPVNEPLSRWLLGGDDQGNPAPSQEFLSLLGQRNDRDDPLKILIVVNTVKRCQSLAKALRGFGFDLVCYHSKFTFDDRRAKERRINDDTPRLLIATQVVEVSLDIDYDILLTECAPIDAVAQRAGRVNRARRSTLGRVWIFPAEGGSETIYGRPEGVLEATWDLCRSLSEPPTEGDLIGMVETIYSNRKPQDDEAFRRIQGVVEVHQNALGGVLDSPRPHEDDALKKTRDDDYPQISVIPAQFAEIALASRPRERKRYELKVPVWYAREHGDATKDLLICRMEYGPEFGAELLPCPIHPDPGNEII